MTSADKLDQRGPKGKKIGKSAASMEKHAKEICDEEPGVEAGGDGVFESRCHNEEVGGLRCQ